MLDELPAMDMNMCTRKTSWRRRWRQL